MRISTEVIVIIATHHTGKPHIIVVSGDGYTHQRIRYLLSPDVALLRFYLTGKELLNEATLGDSDCLLLESRLADMDGLALFTLLKRDRIAPPTIMLAGGDGASDLAIQAIKAGIYDYIEKPFTAQRLIGALRGAMGDDGSW